MMIDNMGGDVTVKRKQLRNRIMVAAVSILLLQFPMGIVSAAPHTTYIGSNTSSSVKVPVVKPVWSLEIDKQTEENGNDSDPVYAAASGGKIFTLKKGQLIAVNVKTGKTFWKAGNGLTGNITVEQNRIFTRSANGKLNAFDTAGKHLWTSTVKFNGIKQLAVNNERVIVSSNGDVKALNLKDGKLLWTDNYDSPIQGPFLLAGDIVLAEGYESGAYSYTVLYAIDGKSGKSIWHNANQSLPIYIKDGKALAQRESNILEKLPLTTIDTLDLKTGKVLSTTTYNPERIDVSQQEIGGSGKAWIADNKIYINMSDKVYAYPQNADPSKTTPQSYFPQGVGKGVTYAAGPHAGRFLFTDGYALYGAKLVDNMPVYYPAVQDQRIARVEMIGRGFYAALTDGSVVAVNLTTAMPVLKLETGGRVFGQTILESGMIVVQTEGRLLAIKEPQSLKTP